VTNSGLSLINDLVLFSIPIAMISILQLPKSRKIVLSLVLLPGTLVIGYVECMKKRNKKYTDRVVAYHAHVSGFASSANGGRMAPGTTTHNWSSRSQKSEERLSLCLFPATNLY
jgi:hypothetical protein